MYTLVVMVMVAVAVTVEIVCPLVPLPILRFYFSFPWASFL